MIFDTHCHYNLEPLRANWQHHWQQAQTQGVSVANIIGTEPMNWSVAIKQARQYPNLYVTLGLHPSYIQKLADASLTKKEVFQQIDEGLSNLRSLAKQEPNLIAIGETGLDYYRLPKDPIKVETIRTAQQYGLRKQTQLAQEFSLPLVLHVRDRQLPEQPMPNNAYWDTLEILKKAELRSGSFVLHCASGPQQFVKECLDMGAYLGMAGNFTYPSADSIRRLATLAPIDRLLIETDAPYLAPQTFRGQICQPYMIVETLKFVVEQLQVTPEKLMQNSLTCFGLNLNVQI